MAPTLSPMSPHHRGNYRNNNEEKQTQMKLIAFSPTKFDSNETNADIVTIK